jgi:hypothetical protein
MNCDIENLECRIFHGLKSLLSKGDTLPPRYLEMISCEAFGLTHVGDGNFYADGVGPDSNGNIVQASVKTRMLNPEILKTKSSRDFISHPKKFLGPRQNKTQNKWWAGLEFVQRRQEVKNENKLSPRQIGRRSVVGFLKNIKESTNKFKTNKTYEIIIVHGYNTTGDSYLVNVYWQEFKFPALNTISWASTPNGVDGYDQTNQIVMHRVRGGAKREATCLKEYKDPTVYTNSVSISVPIPDPWAFNIGAIRAEISKSRSLKVMKNLIFSRVEVDK